jgi:hypothetical protein
VGSNDSLSIIRKRKLVDVHNSGKDFLTSKMAKSEDGGVIKLQRPLLPLAHEVEEKPLVSALIYYYNYMGHACGEW